MSCWSNIEGTWSYKDLIGSKFKIKSVRLSYYGTLKKDCFHFSGQTLTLKDIYFRASTDGKIIPLFRMEEICGKLFIPKDLELIEINPVPKIKTDCGKFTCGTKSIIQKEKSSLNNNSEEVIPYQDTELISLMNSSDDVSENQKEIDDDIDSWDIIVL